MESLTASAAVDCFDAFLKIDGISGESTDAKHKDWIELLSYSHGVSQPSTGSIGGGRSGARCDHSDFSIVKTLDKASPKLSLAACDGRHISEVRLELCKPAGDRETFMQYFLTDVIVTSALVQGDTAGDRPLEEISFDYEQIEWIYAEPPPENHPPVADADGPYVIDKGVDLVLDGTASFDPDTSAGDSIVAYRWDLDDDGMFDDATGAQPTIPWATVSVLMTHLADPSTGLPTNTIRLEVEDSLGLTSTDSTTVTIYDNRPFASFTANPNPAAYNQPIDFDASASSHGHPDHSIVSYEWDFDASDGVDLTNPDATGVNATHSYPLFGTYTVTLQVTDDNTPAKTDTATLVIDVNQGNHPPVADADGPYWVEIEQDLTLDGTTSFDPDDVAGDSIVSYEWDLKNDGTFEYSGPVVVVPWTDLETLQPEVQVPIRLRVTDTFGATGEAATHLVIGGASSVAAAADLVFEAWPSRMSESGRRGLLREADDSEVNSVVEDVIAFLHTALTRGIDT
jgi:type VI secretion system secreted protein Hcp